MNLRVKSNAFETLRAKFAALADPAALDAATEKGRRYLAGRMASELEAHRKTGTASSALKVVASRAGHRMTVAAYALAGNFKPGSKAAPSKAGHFLKWSFFKGTPITAIRTLTRYYADAIRARLEA